MEFGIFDHVDLSGAPLAAFYRDRLSIVEQYDRAGFYSYHVAEHHFTPLGAAASPSVYLSAVAQRTRRLRFGPMVYCLPLYHPLRLAEEICMLDQMSGGRLDVGVGRGISPLESRSFGENPELEVARKVYAESLDILRRAMRGTRFTYEGQFRQVEEAEMVLSPLQAPMPPLWMGVTSPDNAEFAGRQRMNMLGLQSPAKMRPLIETFRKTWIDCHGSSTPPPKAGVSLFIVVAETDARAQSIAQRAYKKWHRSFHYLYHLHGRAPVHGERPDEFSVVEQEGRGVAGSPDKVLEFLKKAVREGSLNYLVGQFVFGDMKIDEAAQSIDLFASKVMPALSLESVDSNR